MLEKLIFSRMFCIFIEIWPGGQRSRGSRLNKGSIQRQVGSRQRQVASFGGSQGTCKRRTLLSVYKYITFVVDNEPANQDSQCSSVPTYNLVVHNVGLYRLGGAKDDFACSSPSLMVYNAVNIVSLSVCLPAFVRATLCTKLWPMVWLHDKMIPVERRDYEMNDTGVV